MVIAPSPLDGLVRGNSWRWFHHYGNVKGEVAIGVQNKKRAERYLAGIKEQILAWHCKRMRKYFEAHEGDKVA